MSEKYTLQHCFGFEVQHLHSSQVEAIQMNNGSIARALNRAYQLELNRIGIDCRPRTMRGDEVRPFDFKPEVGMVTRPGIADILAHDAEAGRRFLKVDFGKIEERVVANNLEAVGRGDSVEPGTPLRQFVRGFLRDHLGMSKIVAHTLADLFMKRWRTARKDGTAKRYAEEMDDGHTLAATFDRLQAEAVDARLGMTDRNKGDCVKTGNVLGEGGHGHDGGIRFDPKASKQSAGA